MGYRFLPNRMYRMPTHFGPATGPRAGRDGERYECLNSPKATRWTVRFRTDRSQLEALLPEGFGLSVGADPVVSVDYTVLKEIDWLAGRGYNTLGVSFPAAFEGERDHARGTFLAVLWENMAEPIMTGREELGFSKIFCELPEPLARDGETHCTASWDGYRFMDLATRQMQQLTPDEIALRLAGGAGDGQLHLKYVPRTGAWGEADAAYVTMTPAGGGHAEVQEMWVGEGDVRFIPARWEDMPTQYMIVNALAGLEVRDLLGAMLVRWVGGKNLDDQRILR